MLKRKIRVLCQKWEESERGWGVRPDGFSLHRDEEARRAYIKKHNDDLPDEVPDEYDRPCGTAYWCEVELEEEVAASIESGRGRRFFNSPYPGDGGPDGWITVKQAPASTSEAARPKQACGNSKCGASTAIDGITITFGSGELDEHGFWEKPCSVCARAYEKKEPGKRAWPFDSAPASTDDDSFLIKLTLPQCGLLIDILGAQLERDHPEHRPATEAILARVKKAMRL